MEGAQILGFFDGSLPYPTNGTQYEKQQYTYHSMMAYTILLRNITPTQQQNIRSYRGYGNSAELAYNHLKNLYQATDSVNQSRLMAQLTTIEMKPGEKGMAYISRCRELRDKLLRCGGSISEDAFVTVVIGGLGPHWRSTRAILRAHGKISEAALCAEIHAEQQDMDLQEERYKKKASAPEFAFHTQRRYNNNNRQQQPKPVPPFCHICKTSGHPRTHCPNRQQSTSPQRQLRPSSSQVTSTQANPTTSVQDSTTSTGQPAKGTRNIVGCMAKLSDSCTTESPPHYSPEEQLDETTPRRELLQPNPTYAAIAQSEPSGKDTWFLDSCCGQHMCSSGRFVQREHQLRREVVITVDNNQNLRTRQQGIVQLQSRETNVILQMSKVLIAEGLGYNLLSVTETTPAAAETTSAAAETTSAAAGTTAAAATTTSVLVDEAPPTPAQQLHPAPREVHRSANFIASFYSNSDIHDMALAAFAAWLPVAERESGVKLKSLQSDGGGEYTSQRFKQYLAERGIKQLLSLPYAHQQQGVAERMNRTLQNSMRKLLRGMWLPNHQWPAAMDHAVMLHNLLSSSSLPNNASPHLLWTGKQGSTKMLRVFGCMVQYRPPAARAGRFSQCAQWGLHLGIEKSYNAWKIFDVHSKETVAARDVIFYERLTLQTYLANLQEDQDPTGGFRGNRAFASAEDEADWDEQNVDNASEEVGPLPFCSVDVPMDDDNPRESVNAETFYHFADNGYVTPATVNTNEAERVGPNFIRDPEEGDEAAYPEDETLPRYTQSGLQILGLVTAVHGTNTPQEPATVQQALGGEHKEKWREAMDRELKALKERNTWKIVPISMARNKTILTGKWVFRVKTKADGTIDKFKARWVVRGFDQEHGRDFTETFALVSRHTSLRVLLAVAAMKRKKLRQIDVANAFLYAPVDA
ncbi:unnamed protein product [Closterium sp. NIES-54]